MPFQWRQNVLHSATVRVKDVDLHIKMCHASQSSFVFASILLIALSEAQAQAHSN